jgi:MoxR-like ATPase
MSTQTKQCDACGASVTYTGHRGFGAAHNCPKRGADASDASHPVCPTHKTLVWVVGPYSTFRSCSVRSCASGKRGKPYRFCAPRGATDDDTKVPGTERDDDIDTDTTTEAPANMTDSTPTPANGDVQSALAQLMVALQPKAPAIDLATVQAIVNSAVDAKLQAEAKVTLVIERRDDDVKVEVEHPHPYLARAIRLARAGIPVYLWGPAGGGKTTAAQQIASALGLDFELDTLDRTTSRSQIQGFMSANGTPVQTSFTRCYSEGKLYCADELDLAPGQVQTLKNSSLANGHAPFAWGNVERAKGFAYVGTGNTPGMPTREYPDRQPMSAAFKDRLYFMLWPVDEQAERAWAGVGGKAKRQIEALPEAREITAVAWVDYVQAMREWARTNAPTLQITPRASKVGLKALACGETPAQVADGLIFRGADAELRTKALNAVRIP